MEIYYWVKNKNPEHITSEIWKYALD